MHYAVMKVSSELVHYLFIYLLVCKIPEMIPFQVEQRGKY